MLTAPGAQMKDFKVYGQTAAGEGTPADLIYDNTGATYPEEARFEIPVEPARQISFIRIERTGFLAICEVEAYEGIFNR